MFFVKVLKENCYDAETKRASRRELKRKNILINARPSFM